MKFTKEDKRDLLKLAEIIDKKEFFDEKNNVGGLKTLPKNKRDGTQFNLQEWFFSCGMPACAATHGVCEFPERFGYDGYIKGKREDKHGLKVNVNHEDFALAFNLSRVDSLEITEGNRYPDSCGNPEPGEVADRIRYIVYIQEEDHA